MRQCRVATLSAFARPAKLGGADEAALRLWASANEKDVIERECGKARHGLSSEVRERINCKRR